MKGEGCRRGNILEGQKGEWRDVEGEKGERGACRRGDAEKGEREGRRS